MITRQPVAFIIDAVCEATGISRTAIMSRSRTRQLVLARGAVVWIARKTTRRSFPELGQILGGRDHSTIINCMRIAEEERPHDGLFAAMLDEIAALTHEHIETASFQRNGSTVFTQAESQSAMTGVAA